ncbi:anti-sigma factor family protein [Pseudonocardia sp. H11422]|uniref:anti-sigma factor family protein n=1 Tax=Pseudonocardia sp. H11422 TaxID=2835866 RepID=UPI001BDC7269|nr:zf-HC2 domain-containing protein [Pseudonocardia sp. H11422]
MTDARRLFSVSTPDWGETHLSPDAIVAFVDDELTAGAHARATQHLGHCPECSAEVVAQGQARSMLRSAAAPSIPTSLLSALRSIPQDTDLPAPPAGLAMTADGQLVSVLRPVAAEPARPSQPVRPSMPPGADARIEDARIEHGRRTGVPRRIRLGAGAAVSGLALGALAFGAPSASIDAPDGAPSADRGVLGGSLLGDGSPAALDARLTARSALSPAGATGPAPEVGPADLARRLDTMPPSFPGVRRH